MRGRTGAQHPVWKGGTKIDRDGYLVRYDPQHPWPRSRYTIREHIRVMELHRGCRLADDEVVHHLDGNRLNNDLANLVVMDAADHARHHREIDTPLRPRDRRGCFEKTHP